MTPPDQSAMNSFHKGGERSSGRFASQEFRRSLSSVAELFAAQSQRCSYEQDLPSSPDGILLGVYVLLHVVICPMTYGSLVCLDGRLRRLTFSSMG